MQSEPRETLRDKTLTLLRNTTLTTLEVSQRSGISLYWLKKFRANEIPDPSVNRVQTLYEFLVGSALKV